MTEGFLNNAYGARDSAATRKLYDDWAASYEAEIAENGYATPTRCAEALRSKIRDASAPILDFGCGTGLSGLALKLVGFETIDGVDLSQEMLNQAREKGVYRKAAVIRSRRAAGSFPRRLRGYRSDRRDRRGRCTHFRFAHTDARPQRWRIAGAVSQ